MKKLTTEEFIRRSNIIHNHIYDYTNCEYLGSHTKVKITCPNGHFFEQEAQDHLNGHGCVICRDKKFSKSKLYSIDEIKRKLTEKYDDKFSFDFENYETLESKIKCICREHGEFIIRVSSLLKGFNCWKCRNTQPFKLDYSLFIEKAIKIHGEYYDYSNVVYVDNKQKIKIKCPNHGDFFQTPGAHLAGQGCPICKMSKGEKSIRLLLISKNIDFIPQHSFNSLKKYSFDFYLPKFNICIEYDGEYHFNEINRVGGKTYLEKIKKRDNVKNDFCKLNNIDILRIPYWNFNEINKIINDYLEKMGSGVAWSDR